MRYLNRSFAVPVASSKVSQDHWDRIFGPNNQAPTCQQCGAPYVWPSHTVLKPTWVPQCGCAQYRTTTRTEEE